MHRQGRNVMLTEILKEVASELEGRSINVTFATGDPIDLSTLRAQEESRGISLPPELVEIYTREANGVFLAWDESDTGGIFELPPLEKLFEETGLFRHRVAEIADDRSYIDKYTDPPHRARAYEIWDSMKSWILIHSEPDGDEFCIRAEDGHVVFNKHDWFDGFGNIDTTNGVVAGTSLVDFISRWSRFYFTCPTSLWWGDCVEGEIFNWDESLFDPEFTRSDAP
jgi:hypothetical protein